MEQLRTPKETIEALLVKTVNEMQILQINARYFQRLAVLDKSVHQNLADAQTNIKMKQKYQAYLEELMQEEIEKEKKASEPKAGETSTPNDQQ